MRAHYVEEGFNLYKKKQLGTSSMSSEAMMAKWGALSAGDRLEYVRMAAAGEGGGGGGAEAKVEPPPGAVYTALVASYTCGVKF